ncbi:uncharacterized protein LOC141528621 [Cotesia typhae]|uniref:uncharacterized protein LOC141528621 n=1 Tax=Cotesia typhae TaxID=2053667 RepID=UPI003D698C1B
MANSDPTSGDVSDFTTNDEIDAFTNGDTMVSFKGKVAWVDGVKFVKSGKKLFRFVMTNNAGRQIRILVWDKQGSLYQQKVEPNMVLKFSRLKCLPADPLYAQAAENVVSQELTVQFNTTVTWPAPSTMPLKKKVVTISEISEEFGMVSLTGYVKDEFEEVSYNNNSYSSGSITDGEYKVKVQVRSYVKVMADKLTPGVHVQVQGQINRERLHGLPYIQCNSFNDVKIVDDECDQSWI